MREVGIIWRTKHRYKVRTSDSSHNLPIVPNFLRDMSLTGRANRVWVRRYNICTILIKAGCILQMYWSGVAVS